MVILTQSFSGYWGWLAPVLLFIYVVGNAMIKSWKKRKKNIAIVIKSRGLAELPTKTKTMNIPTITNIVVKTTGNIVLLLLAFGAGYIYSQYRININRFFYTDVNIIDVYDNTHFAVQPARMASWDMTTCEPT